MENKSNNPINLAIPNITREKMEAIVALSKAIEALSNALTSVHTNVTIANNHLINTETGISIALEEQQ